MVKVNFLTKTGEIYSIEAVEGTSVMRAALANGVPGIVGLCGGECACATCHVYIASDWIGRVGQFEEESDEADILDLAYDVTENSRLSCQIVLTPELDGLIVTIPENQL